MKAQLETDLDHILPMIAVRDLSNASIVLKTIEAILPDREGSYTISEIEIALEEIRREYSARNTTGCALLN